MGFKRSRILSFLLSAALILGVVLVPGQIAFADEVESQSLTLVHVNDVHGRVKDDDYEGAIGYPRLKTMVDLLKAKDPNVLLLNAGDTVHGTTLVNVTEGETMINLMNVVGFDAMVPGNHDFNYGYKRLLELAEMADFPILGANIIKEADGSSDFEPYTIKEFEGFKVGIFGLGTDETKFKSHPKNTEGIKFEEPIDVAKKMVKELEEKEVDIIIALVHLGIDGTSSTTSKELAEAVEGIDVIIDGHSHEILNEIIGETLLVQSESYTKNLGVVELEIKDGKIANRNAFLINYEEAQDFEEDPLILEEIVKIEEINKPIVEEVVGKTIVDLVGERGSVRTGETNLGNMITDAMVKSTGADIAFTNGGGIRATIEAGDIKVNDILTSFPFTNTLAVIEVTGAELTKALERGVDSYPNEAGHFPHVSGFSYTFNPDKPVGERIVDVMVNGEAIKDDQVFKMVTNDFLAAGGDGYTMFEGKPFVAEGGLLSDVLIEYVKAAEGELEPKLEDRILAVKVEDPGLQPEPEVKKYIVKPGDVLWKIARSFETTWEVLAEFNKLKNPHLIFPGQGILVPQ